MHFKWPTPPGPYRATTCQERELTLERIHTFWPHKDMEDLLGWGISSMLGPPPRKHKHERRYTPSMYSFVLTRWIWRDDYAGQMIFGDLVLQIRKNPVKNSSRNLSRPGIEPEPAAWEARMLPPAPRWWTFFLMMLVWKRNRNRNYEHALYLTKLRE